MRRTKSVIFGAGLSVHRYPPAIWGDEEEDEENIEWDNEDYSNEDVGLAEEQEEREMSMKGGVEEMPLGMEPDDGMSWEEGAVERMQAQAQQSRSAAQVMVTSPTSDLEEPNAARRQQQLAQQRQ